MMWTNVCSNFEGETAVFGQRNEEKAGSQLYEVRTQFTICADSPVVPVKPVVNGAVSQKHFAVAIDDVVNVFKHCSFLFSKRFDAAVDAVALCSDVLDGLLIVAERSGNLHMFTVEDAHCIVKLPVPSKRSDDDTGALFRSVDVKKSGDSYTVCVLTGHHVITARINRDVIAQLSSTHQPDLSPLQIRIVDVTQHLGRQDLMLSLVPLASVCVLDDDLLVTGGQGTLCCIPMDATISASGIFHNVAGERVRKMVVVDSLCTLLILTEGSRLVSICLKTFLIKDVWSEKIVEDFVFCEEAASRTERGREQEWRVAVLTAMCEISARRLEVYSIPDFSMLYALEVHETCHIMPFCDSLDGFWIVEGFSDNEETLIELRVRTISEALPENHLMKLINKNKFAEAEKFAELFNLCVKEVHWHHLLSILNDMSTRQTDSSVDADDELNLVQEACNLIKVLPDVVQVARCCIETPIASATVACKLLLFLREHVSAQDCGAEEQNEICAQIMLLLNRATTFRLLCDNDFKSDWFTFSQADLIQEICVLFRDDHVSAGFVIWERHQDEFLQGLSCDVIERLLDSIQITVDFSSLSQWLKDSFLPLMLRSLPESLECICQWIVDRVLQMEVSSKSLWPSGALRLVKVVLDNFQMTSTTVDNVPLNTWLVVHGAPRRIRDKTSALCKLYHLYLDLQNLEVLWGKYKCRLTLQELQNTDKQEVAFAVLDEAISKQQVLQSYIEQVLGYREISLMCDELLEDEMVALVAFIDHPQCWLYAVRNILSHAHVPWSESIQELADQGCLLRGSAAREIEQERKRMQAKLILMGYDVNLFRSVALGTTSTLVRCILLSEKQEALKDALTVAKNLGDMSESDVFLLYLQMTYAKADIDRFAEVLQSVPREIAREVSPRLCTFAELLLQRHSIYPEARAAGLMECWQYLLSVLQQSPEVSDIDYGTLRCRVRQGVVLRRDFGITVFAADFCCEDDKREVMKQGFQKLLSNAMTNQNPAALQSVLEQMEKSVFIDVGGLASYCSSFNMNIEVSLSRRLEFLLCAQADDPCAKGWSLPQRLAEASRVLGEIPKMSVQKVLMKVLAKVNPYHYEILRFGYNYIRAIEEGPEISVQREIDILNFLESYERYSPPSEQEMELWFEEYPLADISSLMQSRLPFRHLLKPTLWLFITNELYPETVHAWLNVADTLRLDKDDIRFIAVDNATRTWSAQHHKGNVLDVTFLASVKRLIVQMSNKEKAIACLVKLVDNLPRGPTASRVAKECATLPDTFFGSGEAKSKASDAKTKFRKKYIKLRNEQLLKQYSLNSTFYLSLCNRTADLVAALLEDTRWHLVFSDTSALYSCIEKIAADDDVISVDFFSLLEKSVMRWLGFEATENTGNESAMELNLEASHVLNTRRCAGFITVLHLMQHIPEQMKELLSCTASLSDSFVGLRPRVLATMCMLAGLGVSDPSLLNMPQNSSVSNLEELTVLAYKARLSQLGIPLPSLSLDADSASEIASTVLHLASHSTVALELVCNLCIEYHVRTVSTWEAFLSAATSAGATDILCRALPVLGGHPLLWSKPAFISAWQCVLQSASAPNGLLPLLLRCPTVQCLPPLLDDDDYYDEEGVLFYFVVVNLNSMPGMLKRIPGEEVRKRLSNPEITLEELSGLMKEFVP
ncbi:hypothetical protein HPB50_006515 [Hyalomma asiaticum]|uniref:Uncharacterized protein n=1 Tax=Hyalomma asiaticum TaxID=266040 RepID=A0ACB7SW65_HYAAI|nr:hypothetical protein HPB50_006515 [Hyalomma asiaticum]